MSTSTLPIDSNVDPYEFLHFLEEYAQKGEFIGQPGEENACPIVWFIREKNGDERHLHGERDSEVEINLLDVYPYAITGTAHVYTEDSIETIDLDRNTEEWEERFIRAFDALWPQYIHDAGYTISAVPANVSLGILLGVFSGLGMNLPT